jgi:hypothetical protein
VTQKIGDEGIIRITEGLVKNASLKELRLMSAFLHFYSAFILASLTLLSHENLLFEVSDSHFHHLYGVNE